MALQSGAFAPVIQTSTPKLTDSIVTMQAAPAASDSNKNNVPMASTAPAKVAAPISVADQIKQDVKLVKVCNQAIRHLRDELQMIYTGRYDHSRLRSMLAAPLPEKFSMLHKWVNIPSIAVKPSKNIKKHADDAIKPKSIDSVATTPKTVLPTQTPKPITDSTTITSPTMAAIPSANKGEKCNDFSANEIASALAPKPSPSPSVTVEPVVTEAPVPTLSAISIQGVQLAETASQNHNGMEKIFPVPIATAPIPTNIAESNRSAPAITANNVATRAPSGSILKVEVLPKKENVKTLLPTLPATHFLSTNNIVPIVSAPKPPLSVEAVIMEVWTKLNAHEHAFAFRKPVNRKRAPNYDQIIKRPIDLSTMKRRINSQKITTVSQFMKTMQLLRDNAALYNGEESTYTYSAQILIDFAKKLFAEANVDYSTEPSIPNGSTRRSKRKREGGSQPNSRTTSPLPLDTTIGAVGLDSDEEDVVIEAIINGGARRVGRPSKAISKALESRRNTRRRKTDDPNDPMMEVPLVSAPPLLTPGAGARGRRKRGRQPKGIVK